MKFRRGSAEDEKGTIIMDFNTKKTGMLYPAMGRLTSYVPNRYLLVNVVARRARQIAEEAEEAGEHLDEKPVTLAIDEVAEGRINASQMDLTIEEENVPEEAEDGHLLR